MRIPDGNAKAMRNEVEKKEEEEEGSNKKEVRRQSTDEDLG